MKSLLNAVFAMAGSGLSQDTELRREVSPGGNWTALLIERVRGVGMPTARHVRIRRSGWPVWSTVFVMQGRPDIGFRWDGDERLVIEAPEGRVYKKIDRVDEVEVEYHTPPAAA